MTIPKKHVSVDIESWGKRAGYDIRSIGAVRFDPTNIDFHFDPDDKTSCFYIACENPLMGLYSKDHHTQKQLDCIGGAHRRYNLQRDMRTVEWWHDSKQKQAAKDAFENPVDLRDALLKFSAFILSMAEDITSDGQARDVLIYTHGAAFDPGLLEAAFYACGMTVPWFYRSPRDTRSIFDDADIEDHTAHLNACNLGMLHHALYDAASQAKAIGQAKQIIAGWKKAIRRLNQECGDLYYRNTLMLQLLGPKAFEYMQLQDKKGVAREHISWGPNAASLTGEERAQYLLDTENAINRVIYNGSSSTNAAE